MLMNFMNKYFYKKYSMLNKHAINCDEKIKKNIVLRKIIK